MNKRISLLFMFEFVLNIKWTIVPSGETQENSGVSFRFLKIFVLGCQIVELDNSLGTEFFYKKHAKIMILFCNCCF